MDALLLAGTVSRYPAWSEKQLQSLGSSPQVVDDSVGREGPSFQASSHWDKQSTVLQPSY